MGFGNMLIPYTVVTNAYSIAAALKILDAIISDLTCAHKKAWRLNLLPLSYHWQERRRALILL